MLPFNCIGSTTCLCAAGKEIDQLIFAVTVLTSDNCNFQTSVISITEKYADSVDSAISELLEKSEEKPTLFLSYFPLMYKVSGDMILTEINKAADGIPLFGTIAADHKNDYSTVRTIHNGTAYREAVVLGAIYGNPKFSFEVIAIAEDKIRKQKAVITESDGNILIGVNGKPALEYLEEIGLTKAELVSGLGIVPLVVDHKDGTKPVARAAFTLTPEGRVVCGGAMPVGATLAIGGVSTEDVLHTTEKALRPFVEKDSVILSYSCMARYFALGANHTAEAEKVREMAGDSQYLFAYSGGEICPLPDAEGRLKNFFHNYTNVFCKLS